MTQEELIFNTQKWFKLYEIERAKWADEYDKSSLPAKENIEQFRQRMAESYKDSVLVPAGLGFWTSPHFGHPVFVPLTKQGETK